MERSKIPMLSRFDAISHIMPYFGKTHRAFLLLAGLCSETRCKLDEFYDEFVTCMKENWRYIWSNKSNKRNSFYIPNDLFWVCFGFIFEEDYQALIKLILNIRDSKGWYFNSHYMHSKIKIQDPISFSNYYIKKLYGYIDLLKSTQVILCKENINCSKIQYESSTLDTNCNHTFFIFK